ncbi:MAG: hypothetical protein ILP16_02185 [Spirochaetales bacterium]|nr:hypothetical protein [Spirochaetales bacterium]
MIKVENKGDQFAVSMQGSGKSLMDECSGVIEELVNHTYKSVAEVGGHDMAKDVSALAFSAIIGLSVERIKRSLGFDILDVDYEEEDVKPVGSPFTMGMSGEALLDFLKGMKGEI